MGNFLRGRRGVVIALVVCFVLLFLSLATLNAFNLSFLNPASPLQTLVFIALSILAFLLFVGVLILLVRNVVKLYADQRSRVLGTRLRTRMLWGAVLVSVIPLVFMFLFSYLLMNRSVERWFSQPSSEMREQSNSLIENITLYVRDNARTEAQSIAVNLSTLTAAGNEPLSSATMLSELHHHDATLQGGFTVVYRDGQPVASIDVPQTGELIRLRPSRPPDAAAPDDNAAPAPSVEEILMPGPTISAIYDAARSDGGSLYKLGGLTYVVATSRLKSGGLVVVALPIPPDITANSQRLSSATANYWALFRQRRTVRNLFMLLLLLITGLALFGCCWLALNLSKQVTRPVESLADAMEKIAAGDYAHRVEQSATEELGELVESFNTMAADLESAHTTAEQSTAQLSQLNATLQQRRTELETIIETIPNGVVTLSASRHIVVANRAFSEMLDPGGQKQFVGTALNDVLPGEIVDTLDRLLRRAHRMGSASASMEMQSASGLLYLSATVAVLEGGAPADSEHLGYVLVLEDATELLRAQKQSAWKEVARRVAHEIKNPLTPISLNAELIQRHVNRIIPLFEGHHIDSTSPSVIQRSAEVISSSVQTMRSLVDQFSSLAEFPSARPRPADLNAIVETALALFAGRLGSIRVYRNFAPNLPLVLGDPEALKRAFSNLIDNAAEAMQDSLLRELHLSTRLLDSGPGSTGMVEFVVADTGPGLPNDMKERLFLPYFSTKQRGTGLGLSIAAKILQEHQGSIRAEKNVPAGARFIIELRPAIADESEVPAVSSETSSRPTAQEVA